MSAPVRCITRQDVAALLPPRRKDSQKGDNGRALLCVGSERYTGAALLSAAAALRAGCAPVLRRIAPIRAGSTFVLRRVAPIRTGSTFVLCRIATFRA